MRSRLRLKRERRSQTILIRLDIVLGRLAANAPALFGPNLRSEGCRSKVRNDRRVSPRVALAGAMIDGPPGSWLGQVEAK